MSQTCWPSSNYSKDINTLDIVLIKDFKMGETCIIIALSVGSIKMFADIPKSKNSFISSIHVYPSFFLSSAERCMVLRS